MAFMKKLFHALWGVNEESVDMKPPIECEECAKARAEGKDACVAHHTHRARASVVGSEPTSKAG